MHNIKLHRETAGDAFGLAPDDIRYDDPIATCAHCGKRGIQSDCLNLVIVVGSLGHHSLFRIKEHLGEQWACSLDCWMDLYMDTGRKLVQEIIEINAEEERSKHSARANDIRANPGEHRLLEEVQRTDSPA